MSNKLRKLSRVDDHSFQERLYREDSFSGYGCMGRMFKTAKPAFASLALLNTMILFTWIFPTFNRVQTS